MYDKRNLNQRFGHHRPWPTASASRFRGGSWAAGLTLAAVLAARGWAVSPDPAPPPEAAATPDPAAAEPREDESSYLDYLHWNLPFRTLGGKQFWTDHLIHGKWRIQRNGVTGHYRLLDAKNVRRAWGSWDTCFEQWNALREKESVAPMRARVVIVLHGLIRTRGSMDGLVEYLEQHTDYEVLNFSYASTRAEVSAHAEALRDVISHLEGVTEINFVAHSLGNLVIRHYLGDTLAASAERRVDPRVKRIVMLAPPNNGARLAERLGKNVAFRLVFGASGTQLAEKWDGLQPRLLVPPCEFGIIAGGGSGHSGQNPLLEGDDDFVVEVEETRLPGARDFIVITGLHSFIMDHPDVQRYTARFLEHGYFISEQQRDPIPVAAGEAPESEP